MKSISQSTSHEFNNIGGEMAELTRTKEWEETPLGAMKGWQQSLRTIVGIILNSRFPMFLFWGADSICFYNDAYRPSLGANGKHPSILGIPGEEAWPEIWANIKPLIDQVMEGGGATWSEDQLLPIFRNGKIEDVYWTFSYSPVNDNTGKIGGVLVTCSETTEKVLTKIKLKESERRLRSILGQAAVPGGISRHSDIHEHKIFRDELEKQVNQRTSELLNLNESLKKSEERYHLMVEEVQDYAILYINSQGIVENWNAGAEKIKGYKTQEIIGKSFSNFYTEEDRLNHLPQKLLSMAVTSGRAVQEGWRVRKDGTLFWASVVITAVHNEKREVIGFSKVTHDLTDKKKAEDALRSKSFELEHKNAELERMNKELQSFAYISSHDLQEPLRKIQTFASRIIEKENENLTPNGKDLFKRMQNSAARMQSLIDDLLAYSRTHTFERDFKNINLAGVIEKVIEDLNEEIQQKGASISMSEMANLKIIPFQLQQLFYNLISNSLKFSKPEIPLQITIKNEVVTGGRLKDERLNKETNYCHIIYADNGIGFEPQYNEKIFELFQRLHKQSDFLGTGIGLSIVKRIVENHNGIITAEGNLGHGAIFNIYLPIQ